MIVVFIYCLHPTGETRSHCLLKFRVWSHMFISRTEPRRFDVLQSGLLTTPLPPSLMHVVKVVSLIEHDLFEQFEQFYWKFTNYDTKSWLRRNRNWNIELNQSMDNLWTIPFCDETIANGNRIVLIYGFHFMVLFSVFHSCSKLKWLCALHAWISNFMIRVLLLCHSIWPLQMKDWRKQIRFYFCIAALDVCVRASSVRHSFDFLPTSQPFARIKGQKPQFPFIL